MASPADYAALAGMSNEAVRAKTGQTWERWVKALDRVEADRWPHREIARHLVGEYGLSGWWSQTVTVGYERIRGLREVGQRRGGSYEVTKTKTVAVAVGKLYRAFSDKRRRAQWLSDADVIIRAAIRDKSLRITWIDGTSVEVYFTKKGVTKSSVSVEHRTLPSRAAATAMKAYWGERLAELAERLTA